LSASTTFAIDYIASGQTGLAKAGHRMLDFPCESSPWPPTKTKVWSLHLQRPSQGDPRLAPLCGPAFLPARRLHDLRPFATVRMKYVAPISSSPQQLSPASEVDGALGLKAASDASDGFATSIRALPLARFELRRRML